MGILFENVEDLFVYLQGGEHLEFVGQVYGLPFETMEERIDALFRFFEMESHRNIIIDDYSKGMKKKLALASILLHDPDFIILDEPFEGLDTLTIVKIKKLLRKLNERGRTILITSHILSYVEDLCEEVAIIHRGHIIYRNQTEKIRSEFSEEVAGNPALSEHALEDLFLKLVEEENGVEKTLAWI